MSQIRTRTSEVEKKSSLVKQLRSRRSVDVKIKKCAFQKSESLLGA